MAGAMPDAEPAWLHGHAHEPNPVAPAGDGDFLVTFDGSTVHHFTVEALRRLPFSQVADCYIVSTGHGASGPFIFGGVRLSHLLAAVLPETPTWRTLDVVSADGFGVRLTRADLADTLDDRPILLACQLDGTPLTRARGLVRLIVPSEVDDALRQVKWVSRIELRS